MSINEAGERERGAGSKWGSALVLPLPASPPPPNALSSTGSVWHISLWKPPEPDAALFRRGPVMERAMLWARLLWTRCITTPRPPTPAGGGRREGAVRAWRACLASGLFALSCGKKKPLREEKSSFLSVSCHWCCDRSQRANRERERNAEEIQPRVMQNAESVAA